VGYPGDRPILRDKNRSIPLNPHMLPPLKTITYDRRNRMTNQEALTALQRQVVDLSNALQNARQQTAADRAQL